MERSSVTVCKYYLGFLYKVNNSVSVTESHWNEAQLLKGGCVQYSARSEKSARQVPRQMSDLPRQGETFIREMVRPGYRNEPVLHLVSEPISRAVGA